MNVVARGALGTRGDVWTMLSCTRPVHGAVSRWKLLNQASPPVSQPGPVLVHMAGDREWKVTAPAAGVKV